MLAFRTGTVRCSASAQSCRPIAWSSCCTFARAAAGVVHGAGCAYALCRFDLSVGQLARLYGAARSGVGSVPAHGGGRQLLRHAGQAKRTDVAFVLMPGKIAALDVGPVPRGRLGSSGEVQIPSPTTEGLVVVRAPYKGIAYRSQTEAALAQTLCAPVQTLKKSSRSVSKEGQSASVKNAEMLSLGSSMRSRFGRARAVPFRLCLRKPRASNFALAFRQRIRVTFAAHAGEDDDLACCGTILARTGPADWANGIYDRRHGETPFSCGRHPRRPRAHGWVDDRLVESCSGARVSTNDEGPARGWCLSRISKLRMHGFFKVVLVCGLTAGGRQLLSRNSQCRGSACPAGLRPRRPRCRDRTRVRVRGVRRSLARGPRRQ